MEHARNPLHIPLDTYHGYKPHLECPYEPVYPDIPYDPILFADPLFRYRLGFEFDDNRYFIVIPERLDVDVLYSDHWQRFLAWARARHPNMATLPAPGVTIAVYLTEVAQASDSAEARIAAEAIHSIHRWASMPSPFNEEILQSVIRSIDRDYPPVNPHAPVKIDLSNPTVC